MNPASESRNPFASGRFTHWWLGSLVVGTGVGIQTVTVPLFIRDRVDSEDRAFAIAAALVAQTLPGALLALVGGTVADRVDRRKILFRTYSIAAVVSIAYVFLSGFDVRAIWPVFPLAAVVGSASVFTNPARQSMLPLLVERSQLQNGVIFGTMGFMASLQFLGPSLAGLLVEFQGLTFGFATETVLLAIGAVVFSRIYVAPPTPTGRNVFQDLAEGVRYVIGEPAIRGLLLLALVPGVFFIGPFSVTVPILVPDLFAVGDKWVGLLWGCFGAGVFAGSVALTIRPFPRRGLATCVSILSGGVVLVLYSQSEDLLVSALLLVVWGFGASVFMNYAVSLIQENTDPRMMGRVMSMYTLAFFASMPIGYAQAGFVTTAFDPQVTLLSSGIVSAIIGVVGIVFSRAVRSLE